MVLVGAAVGKATGAALVGALVAVGAGGGVAPATALDEGEVPEPKTVETSTATAATSASRRTDRATQGAANRLACRSPLARAAGSGAGHPRLTGTGVRSACVNWSPSISRLRRARARSP